MNNKTNIPFNSIDYKDYDFGSAKIFFGFEDDWTRLIIIIFIILSLAIDIIITIILFFYKKKKEFSLSGVATLNILYVNFFRTFLYGFNWVIKNKETEAIIEPNKSPINVGALLFGNPTDFGLCSFQGFFLILLTLSQDIIVNIFLAFVNLEGKEKKHLFILILLVAAYIFPASISIIFYHFDIIGINEKVCNISKYTFTIKDDSEKVEYNIETNYIIYKAIIFSFRLLNFIITLVFIIRACKYISEAKEKLDDKKKEKLISALPVVIITFFTLFVFLIFRILCFIDSEIEEKYFGVYLVLNTVDSILLPLSFAITHEIYRYFLCCCTMFISEPANENDSTFEIDEYLPPGKKQQNELYEQ